MDIHTGDVVWAPYADGEYRVRVVSIEGDTLTLKAPGADAGIFTAPTNKCFPSNGQPHTVAEIGA